MKLQGIFFLLCELCYINYGVATSGTIEDMIELQDKLFTNYSRGLRPARNLNETVRVDTAFFLLSIRDLDEVSGTISLSGGISMYWNDFRLLWKPSDHAGITEMMVHSSRIWKPSIFLVSSASDIERFGSDAFDARIDNNGFVLMNPGKTIKATCTIDMTNFPTDIQKCSLILLPWGYPVDEIHLAVLRPQFIMEYFSPNGEWDVDDTSAEEILEHGVQTSQLIYYLVLKRKPSYFIISLIIPVYTLCFLSPFVFLLPSMSGERISYIITMFLSLAVYMTLVNDNMPKVSKPMSGISYFLLMTMLFSCLLIILTIFTLRCEAVTDVTKFPKCVRRFVLKMKNRKSNRKPITSNSIEFEPHIPSTSDVSVVGHEAEHRKKGATAPDMDEPDNNDVTNCIDIMLFVLAETIVFGLILGFALVYYK
ncbi:Neuronal acetylcholine receptor subunit alpha-6 [Mizuhopecten yessoensis]|uniref:Neuronal acetylcholine receptor subunit alpha-6 n=1 Tax=Mizuhopecten yessoensis TaxID=6573 RepID=A0A210QKA8_MIZYE|nr:Neuronal acetylcholine receptor subunit alpha-6 [Mizuhopecten yessoensis]